MGSYCMRLKLSDNMGNSFRLDLLHSSGTLEGTFIGARQDNNPSSLAKALKIMEIWEASKSTKSVCASHKKSHFGLM